MYKLLIVDDEEIERRAIEYIVTKANMKIGEIRQATNGQDAIAVASVFEPHIIIMDINMPGLDGIKATSVIKKFLPDVHVVFLTAFDEFNYAKEAVKLGADDFVVKPASPETLEKIISDSINSIERQMEQQQKTATTKEKLLGAATYLKECLVEALISGESDESKINKYLSFTNIDFDYSYGSVILIDYDNNIIGSAINREVKQEMIISKIKKEIESVIKKCIFYADGNRLYTFVYHTDYDSISNGQPMLVQVVKDASEKIFNEHSIKLDIGVGSICDSVEKVWNSFSEAKGQILNRIEVSPNTFDINIVDEVAKGVVENDIHQLKEYVTKVQNILQDESETIEEYRTRLIEFSVELKREIIRKVSRPIVINDNLYIKASKTKTTEEGMEYLLHYMKNLCKICAIDDKDKNAIIVNKMTMYIEEHLSENITLDHLSDVSNLSSYYICKLFKKYIEMSFSDYVAYLRIKNAKELLKDPLISIKETSFRLGYADPNYFTRVFKKETGISPSLYRKQHLY